MLALTTLDHETCLLIRTNGARVGFDHLQMDAAQVAAYEGELDDLLDGCGPDALSTGFGHQGDTNLGVAG